VSLPVNKTFSVINGGVSQVLQHKQGSKHASLESASKQQPRPLCASDSISMKSNRKIILSQEEQSSTMIFNA